MSDSSKDIENAEAVEKIKKIVEHVRTCQVMTALDKRPISARPMGIQKVDEAGRIYFLSGKDSDKNHEIEASDEMQITIINDSDVEYLSLYGRATVYRDQEELDEMYSSLANNWFDGKDDPNLTIIRFTPEVGHYWDTKHGKIVQFAGMIAGAITGKPSSNGVEGAIKV